MSRSNPASFFCAAPVDALVDDAPAAPEAPPEPAHIAPAAPASDPSPAPTSGPQESGNVLIAPTPEEIELHDGALAPESEESAFTPLSSSPQEALTQEALLELAEAAKQRWIDTGLTEEQITALNSIVYEIVDLGGNHLGAAQGYAIQIDDDAAGTSRWFIDQTPDQDEEFLVSPTHPTLHTALNGSEADARVDLLTVLMHEQGHVLGLSDRFGSASGNLMDSTLDLEQRKLPSQMQAILATPGSISDVAFLTLAQQAKLTASDATGADQFGFSVAISGDTAIIGAYLDDDAGTNSGSAYVFTRSGTSWTQQAKLTASDAAGADQFGFSVAISGDTVIIGARLDDDGSGESGSAYVFARSGSTWTQQAKLTASDAAFNDQFGNSVAISGDTAIIGAYADDDGGTTSGSAYVFTRSGTSWTQQAKLTASDAASSDEFGWSVAISGDTAIIGAYLDDSAGPFTDSGSAYVFTRSGTTWTQQAKLIASDAAFGDFFGRSVAIGGDTAIIGAHLDDDVGNGSGSAYVFTRSGTTWTQQAKLTASDAAGGDQFGSSVAISGESAIIGAHLDNGFLVDSGSAYVFTRSGTTWTQQAKLTASDADADDRFGYSVAISGDTVISGAYRDDDGGSSSGSAYVFAVANTAPTVTVGTLAYTEGQNSGNPVTIDSTATANDADGDADWNGGSLAVQITANAEAADELSIGNVGPISVSGSNIVHSTAGTIGTVTAASVTNNAVLTVNLGANATNAAVQDLVRAIQYRNTSSTPGTNDRTVTYTVTDANSANGTDTATISVTAVTAGPTVSSPGAATTVNAASFNITGTAAADALVRVFLDANNDGVADTPGTPVASQQLTGGATSFAIITNLTQDATNNFVVTAQVSGENESAAVDVSTITEDSTAPANPTVTTTATTLDAASINVTGTAEADSLVEVFIDANNDGVPDTPGTPVSSQQLTGGATSFSISTNLTQDADNNFVVVVSDAAGNESSPVDVPTITEDSTAPANPTLTGPTAPTTVDAPNTTITGTAEANALVEVFVDANNDGVQDTPGTPVSSQQLTGGATSFSISTNLTQDAANNFVVVASDAAGNESSPVDVPTVTEDSTAPANPTVTTTATTVDAASINVTGTAEANSLVEVFLDANNDGTPDTPGTPVSSEQLTGGATNYSISTPLTQDADNNFVVVVSDAAGNESSPVDVPTVTEDSTAPANPTLTGPTAPTTVDAASTTISGTAEANALVEVFIDANNDGVPDSTTPVASQQLTGGATNYSISTPLTQDADNNFVVVASDAAGNKSSAVDVPTITEDSTVPAAPTFTGPTAPTIIEDSNAPTNPMASTTVDFLNGGSDILEGFRFIERVSFRYDEESVMLGFGEEQDSEGEAPLLLTLMPMYSGLAEPGTVITVRVFGQAGEPLVNGEITVVADAAGSWLANMPGLELEADQSHTVVIEQTQPTWAAPFTPGKMHTYFAPPINQGHAVLERLTPDAVLGRSLSRISHEPFNGNAFKNVDWRNSIPVEAGIAGL